MRPPVSNILLLYNTVLRGESRVAGVRLAGTGRETARQTALLDLKKKTTHEIGGSNNPENWCNVGFPVANASSQVV